MILKTVLTFGNDIVVNYIKNSSGNNYVLWFISINLILFDIYAIWKLSGKVEKILKNRRLKKQEKIENNVSKTEDTVINDEDEDTVL